MGPSNIDLAAVRCPATFFVGQEDHGHVGQATWLHQAIGHGDLRVLPGHGHLVAFELWDDVLDALGV